MNGPDIRKLLAQPKSEIKLRKNTKLKQTAKKKRAAADLARRAWEYPESEHLCELAFVANSRGACVATISSGNTVLLSATHPASILAVMYLTNSAVRIRTPRGTGKFDPAWNLGTLEQAAAAKQLGFSKCSFTHLARSEEEREWLENFWMFSHDSFEKPSPTLDEYIRSSEFYLRHLGLGHLISRPLRTPNPDGWEQTLKKRHEFTYYPDL